jgi:hypothetical protein
MGQRLYEMGLSDSGEDWMIFAAADHQNANVFNLHTLDDKISTIKLNLEVGQRATRCAAYETASKYLGTARQILLVIQDPWTTYFDLSLRVHQAMAEVELCRGNFDFGRDIGSKVLEHAKSLDDMIPTQMALSKAFGREKKHREALAMSVSVLQKLQEYPKGNVGLYLGLVKDFMFVKSYLQKKTDSELLGFPLMKNERKEAAMAFLLLSSYQGYACGKEILFVVGTLRMLRITFKHGLCAQSGMAFTGYSLLCNNINDMEGAVRFSRLSRQIIESTKAKHLESMQLFVAAQFIMAGKDPHQEVIETFERAHKCGMETGDIENGLLSMTTCYHYEFVSGYSLGPLDAKFARVVEKLKTYNLNSVLVKTIEQWLVVQYLTGSATSPLDFTELEKLGPESFDSADPYPLLYGYLSRLQLGVYFGDYKFAEKIVRKLAPLSKFCKCFPINSLRLFFSSLTYASLARETRKKSHILKARKYLKQLRTFCKIKGMCSWHRCVVMEAHLKSWGKKMKDLSAQLVYDHAIMAAVKANHHQDAALAAQLAGEHFLSMVDHSPESDRRRLGRKYLTQAREFYRRWGAAAQVERMEKKYAGHLESSLTWCEEHSDHGYIEFSLEA